MQREEEIELMGAGGGPMIENSYKPQSENATSSSYIGGFFNNYSALFKKFTSAGGNGGNTSGGRLLESSYDNVPGFAEQLNNPEHNQLLSPKHRRGNQNKNIS